MTCVYEARRKILEFSSQSVRVDSTQVGVANGKIKGEFESSGETSFISSVGEIPNRSVQIPMPFSEDRIASKAGFTSSGSYTTMAAGATSGQASFFWFWVVVRGKRRLEDGRMETMGMKVGVACCPRRSQ